jgi:uncharacterized membrane protein|tara:strand:- start:101 stop:745 length:645 start_codon:yes stop_codon:yes gene_type:complete
VSNVIADYEPGVLSSYRNGWRQLWKYFWALFLIGIIHIIFTIPAELSPRLGEGDITAFLVVSTLVYSFLILSPIELGVNFSYLKAARGDNLKIKNIFEAFQNYRSAVLASILVFVIITIGVLLLIVPGIIFACKLAFTPYLVVDRKMSAIEAVKGSWHMTNGHAWKIFLMGLLTIPISIAGLFVIGVGLIISIMWVSLAFASLYHAVSHQMSTT